MEKLYDVVGMGELLIDFTMNGKSDQGNNLFEADKIPINGDCNITNLDCKCDCN